ncbi:3-hydroxylacyl-ACP dehydratase [Vogesella oryzae]|uniref:3-hydroxylacyl-ACP dehydratase n=1 Tax=Vogesella oryzae TaxID=1735285 RepID=UPI001FE91862|nr:3-hydroxylacyl-ACP dehydratase [Vogesella oryzae]
MDQAWIAARIPHQGSMCLLSEVVSWSEDDIVCFADSHQLPDNPLRAAGRLGVANAIEYAAQAMAVHGALLAGDAAPARAGYLTSVRELSWHCRQLDGLAAPLRIHAERLSGSPVNAMYRFTLHAGERLLVSGRLGVVLDADALAGKRNS